MPTFIPKKLTSLELILTRPDGTISDSTVGSLDGVAELLSIPGVDLSLARDDRGIGVHVEDLLEVRWVQSRGT